MPRSRSNSKIVVRLAALQVLHHPFGARVVLEFPVGHGVAAGDVLAHGRVEVRLSATECRTRSLVT